MIMKFLSLMVKLNLVVNTHLMIIKKNNDEVHENAQSNNKEPNNDVEIEPTVDLDNPQPKNKKYDKRDFVARKHGKQREPWVQKPMPFPPKPSKKNDDEEFERFAEIIRPIFL